MKPNRQNHNLLLAGMMGAMGGLMGGFSSPAFAAPVKVTFPVKKNRRTLWNGPVGNGGGGSSYNPQRNNRRRSRKGVSDPSHGNHRAFLKRERSRRRRLV